MLISSNARLALVTRGELLAIIQAELEKHDFDCFVDASVPGLEPGRNGIVVPDCSYCKKRLYTMTQFIEHLNFDVLPLIFEREPGID